MSPQTPMGPRLVRWRVQAEIRLARQGIGLWLALLMLLSVVALEVLVLQPRRDAWRALEAQRTTAASAAQPIDPAAHRAAQHQQRLAELQQRVRASPDATVLMDQLLSLTTQHQLVWQQAEYQSQPMPAIGMAQLQVTQPVKASYPQLRRYIEAVLRDMPNASLDQIAVRRDNVGQTQLEVRLKWSFWMPADVGEGRP